jgi:hypothetical protein
MVRTNTAVCDGGAAAKKTGLAIQLPRAKIANPFRREGIPSMAFLTITLNTYRGNRNARYGRPRIISRPWSRSGGAFFYGLSRCRSQHDLLRAMKQNTCFVGKAPRHHR